MITRLPIGLLSVDEEIAQERANTLARLGRQLEAALAALRAFDAGQSATGPRRVDLLDAAAIALWEFVVQREACGFPHTTALMRDYGVPDEVRLRMGVFPVRTKRAHEIG